MDKIELIKKAIEDALEGDALDGYLGETEGGKVLIDGTLDLPLLAKRVLEAINGSEIE